MPEPKVRAKPVRSDLSKAASEAVRTQQDLDKALAQYERLDAKLAEVRGNIQKLRTAAAGAEARWQALRKPAGRYTGPDPEDLESEETDDIEGSDEDPEE